MVIEERRKTQRRRVRNSAVLNWPEQAEPRACTIRNISESGAMLAVAQAATLPARFILTASSGEVYSCELIWRTDAEIGIRFL